MKAVIYLRQSLDKTGESLGVERQQAECRRLCEQRGYEVVQVVTDNNQSASRGTRPGYAQLLQLIESAGCDVVAVLRLDRLPRRLTDLEQLITLVEHTGVQIATVQGDLGVQLHSRSLRAWHDWLCTDPDSGEPTGHLLVPVSRYGRNGDECAWWAVACEAAYVAASSTPDSADPELAMQTFMGYAVNDSDDVAVLVGDFWAELPAPLQEQLGERPEVHWRD